MNRIGAHALCWVGGWSEDLCRHAIDFTRANLQAADRVDGLIQRPGVGGVFNG